MEFGRSSHSKKTMGRSSPNKIQKTAKLSSKCLQTAEFFEPIISRLNWQVKSIANFG